MNGRIIVTIRMDSFQRDMELPEALPLRTLCVQLLELLKQADARLFRTMDEIALAVDSMPMLNGSVSLKDYGIYNGTYLDIVPIEKMKLAAGGAVNAI